MYEVQSANWLPYIKFERYKALHHFWKTQDTAELRIVRSLVLKQTKSAVAVTFVVSQ